jgi:regulation of enolase protein 1 (concanavalin A-like superfamily)
VSTHHRMRSSDLRSPSPLCSPRAVALCLPLLLGLLLLPVTADASSAATSPAAGLTGRDIGAVRVPGRTVHTSGGASVEASGADIWDRADAFHFASRPVSGDATITARVPSLRDTHAWAKAGVMIRDGLSADAAHAFALTTPRSGTALQHRGARGTVTHHAGGPAGGWVRLQRTGDVFTAWSSGDGTTWTRLGSVTIRMGAEVQVGLAVTSHHATALTAASFDRLTVTTAAPVAGSLSAAPAALAFGDVVVGASTEQTVRLTHSGGAPGSVLEVTGVAVAEETHTFAVVGAPAFPRRLAPGEHLDVRVRAGSQWPGAKVNSLRIALTGRAASVIPLTAQVVSVPAPLPSRSVLWSTDFGGASPKAALRVEVEDSPGNLSFPRPAHALDGAVYRARVVAGQRNGHKWRTRFADVPGARGNHLGIGEQSEARLRYRVWVPGDSSVDAVDMKLPGIAGLPPQQTGWQTATGGDQRTDSWSLRIHTRHPRASHFGQPRPQRFLDAYLYAQSAGGKRIGDHRFGMSFPLTDTTRESGRSLRFDLDRWNEIELRVRMNSRGRADGIVEVWLNGVKGVALTDVRFTVDDAVGINQLIAETFYNAPGATRDHAIDIARMAITTN